MGVLWMVQLALNAVLTTSVVYLIWEQKRKRTEVVQVPWEGKTEELESQFLHFREKWERELRKMRELTIKVTDILERMQERRRLPSLEEKELASLTRVASQPHERENDKSSGRTQDLRTLLKEHLA